MNWQGTYATNTEYWLSKTSIPDFFKQEIPKIKNKKNVLDLGCGGGRLIGSLINVFDHLHGIDYSESLLAGARIQYPTVNFIQGDFQTVDYPTSDLIVSNCAIRKDYCPNLLKIADKCNTNILFRIQAAEDLEFLTDKPFFNKKEIQEYFPDAEIADEVYYQKFSSVDYINKFLQRIAIDYKVKNIPLTQKRHYYLVKR